MSSFFQLAPRLWVGPQPTKATLEVLDIDVVISLRRTVSPLATIHYPLTYWHDEFDWESLNRLHALVDLLEMADKSVLIHCHGGVDRSGVFALSYFISKIRPFEDAVRFYSVLRQVEFPRFGGMDGLKHWDNVVRR